MFGLIRGWIRTCDESHSKCQRSRTDRKLRLPTRLIDVGVSTSDVPKLHITAEHPPVEKYSTLSHCWGGNLPGSLKEADVDRFKNGIPPESLTQTFHDAIRVAREIGTRYLWIDSLCIIQDSRDDWRHEAASMSSVYKNSFCNIAATGSENSHGGCFKARNTSIIWPCPVTVNRGDSTAEPVSYFLADMRIWAGVAHSPLCRRGWVTQERLLAPRIVHFGKQQVFWECAEASACEAWPSGLPKELEMSSYHKMSPPSVMFGPESCSVVKNNIWWQLVSEYTQCQITVPEDKLIAISGLAEEFRMSLKDKDLFGLWKSSLLTDLMWTSTPGQAHMPERAPVYRAPSWSWASMDGEI
ncbi:Heterokaryon incompatibility protein (HET) domain containing protein, partial [Elaphomyces granulatus]